MRFAFDVDKDEANRRKHGVTLAVGTRVIENAVTTMMDARFDYGEERFVSFGYLDRRLFACVFAVRDDVTRIISVRKANAREIRRYG